LHTYAHSQFLCSLARFDLANRMCAPVSPAAHFLCQSACIRQDICAASFCSCKLLWRSDECVSLRCCNAQPDYFCSYELLCHSVDFYIPPISLLGTL